ncbi:MAG TPA: hypothetical protein VKQ73_06995, partial [Stellaceae bacterium]|nr:hypothetical protein [Stellaceae bacterium]
MIETAAAPSFTAVSGPAPHNPIPQASMRIAIVTDAWLPQTNGVVRTLMALKHELELVGHDVLMVTPQQFTTIP